MENIPPNFIEEDIKESVARGQTIVTRFPPEPNGYMHIGHAKAFGISFALAKKYGGYTNLRFDDTNPAKETTEFADSIASDIRWLGMNWKNKLFASDYYEQFYDFAVKLIKKGLSYVDDQNAEEISATRGTFEKPGINSPFRDRTVEENLDLFKRMRDGEFKDGQCVLRAKIDMAHPNMNMRDPVMYRIAREKHYRTGDKWCIYPMYDYAHPLEDAIEGISHSICSLEFQDHYILYRWFVENCGFTENPPREFEFSRLNIERTIMSKRWLKRFVDEKKVDSWDDPRMPTISGMRRRGYPPEAIMNFVLSTGITKSEMCVPLSALEHYVRSSLDPVAIRTSVVLNPIKLAITNYKNEKPEELEIANNPHDETAGKHTIYFGRELFIDGGDFSLAPPPKYKRLTVGGHVRLRGAYIVRCDNVVYNAKKEIDYLECTYIETSKSGSDTSGIRPSGVIHFVESATAVDAVVNEFFPLLKEGTALTEDNINPASKISHNAKCESFLKTAKAGETFQFVRKGFYTADKESQDGKLVFNKTVGLKEGF